MRLTCLAAFVCIAAVISVAADELDSPLMRDFLMERSYETGLNTRGISGYLLTSRTSSIFEKGMFLGMGGYIGHLRYPDDITARRSALNLSWAYGLAEDLFGPFENLEISASLPIIVQNADAETTIGLGEALFSGKIELLQEDPLRPSVPAVSFVGTIMLPTAHRDFQVVDSFGAEAGVVFGKAIKNMAQDLNFEVYLEILADYLGNDGGRDILTKVNLGVGFPVAEMDDFFIMLEYGLIDNADIVNTNSSTYLASARLIRPKFTMTAGFSITSYDDVDLLERKLFFMYDMKF